jgi:hypothetical protein
MPAIFSCLPFTFNTNVDSEQVSPFPEIQVFPIGCGPKDYDGWIWERSDSRIRWNSYHIPTHESCFTCPVLSPPRWQWVILKNEREGSIQLRDLVAPELLQVFAHFVLRFRHLWPWIINLHSLFAANSLLISLPIRHTCYVAASIFFKEEVLCATVAVNYHF